MAKKSVVVRKRVDAAKPKLGIGLANVLAQSGVVVEAFGQRLGFVVMVLAIGACAGITGGAAVLFTRMLGRYLG